MPRWTETAIRAASNPRFSPGLLRKAFCPLLAGAQLTPTQQQELQGSLDFPFTVSPMLQLGN